MDKNYSSGSSSSCHSSTGVWKIETTLFLSDFSLLQNIEPETSPDGKGITGNPEPLKTEIPLYILTLQGSSFPERALLRNRRQLRKMSSKFLDGSSTANGKQSLVGPRHFKQADCQTRLNLSNNSLHSESHLSHALIHSSKNFSYYQKLVGGSTNTKGKYCRHA